MAYPAFLSEMLPPWGLGVHLWVLRIQCKQQGPPQTHQALLQSSSQAFVSGFLKYGSLEVA